MPQPMIATVAVKIAVPFKAEIDSLGEPELTATGGKLRLANPAAHEKTAAQISKQRVAAAKQAEKDIAAAVRKALAKTGDIQSVVIETIEEGH